MSGHYLFWHPEEDQIQLIQAMNHHMARSMVTLPKDEELQHYAFQSKKPDELDITAAISEHVGRADATVDAYERLKDEELKPIQRAQKAFSEVFGRAPATKDCWWEAKALSLIVSRWTYKYKEEKSNDGSDNTGDNPGGSIVALAGRARVTKDIRRKHRK